jgi:hypothetical protein
MPTRLPPFTQAAVILSETAEKVPFPLEEGGLKGIVALKSLLISFEEREKLGKENTFSALSIRLNV